MNKPLSMVINDTKKKLVDTCNESQLPISILDLIVQDIYTEIHSLAERQALEDERSYKEKSEEKKIENK